MMQRRKMRISIPEQNQMMMQRPMMRPNIQKPAGRKDVAMMAMDRLGSMGQQMASPEFIQEANNMMSPNMMGSPSDRVRPVPAQNVRIRLPKQRVPYGQPGMMMPQVMPQQPMMPNLAAPTPRPGSVPTAQPQIQPSPVGAAPNMMNSLYKGY